MRRRTLARAVGLAAALVFVGSALADETCQSPYLPRLTGQEDFVYVWTLGGDGLGGGSVGGRHEAHHAGFTDDRRQLWAGGLDDSRIFVFDVHSEPAHPKLVRTIEDFAVRSGGVVGPHTFYALPGRMLITGLSNSKDWGGRTALVEYNNEGGFIRTLWMPEGAEYGYDARVKPELNRMLTSSFTGHANYMRKLGELLGDALAMKRFGNTMVVWDFHARKPLQVRPGPRSSGGSSARATGA